MVRTGQNSNASEILCLSWLPARLTKIWQKKKKVLSHPQHFLHYKSMGKYFDTQGQVALKRIVPSGRKLNLSEILCLSLFNKFCKFNEDPIKNEGAIKSTTFFQTSRQAAPKLKVGSGRNSNSYKILCLSWLSARLMEISSKMKVLSCLKHFHHCKSIGNF